MKYSLIIISFVIIACNSKKEGSIPKTKIQDDVFVFTREAIKAADSSLVLDSVRLLHIDTVTQKRKYYLMAGYLDKAMDKAQKEYDEYATQVKYHSSMMKLAAGLSKTLFENSREESQDYLNKLQAAVDRMQAISKANDSLVLLAQKADSSILINYDAVFIFQITRPDRTMIRDTGNVFLTPDFHLIRREDYLGLKYLN
jgi:hypothetical protein